MADKHTLNYEVKELKLGSSFTNNRQSQYHTIKYDFKPASVDVNKMATVDVGSNNQVTVTVPHLDGARPPATVFRGSQRAYGKECVLIIDRVTGDVTIEKLSSNIQLKKTRQETRTKGRPLTPAALPAPAAAAAPPGPPAAQAAPLQELPNTTQRSSSRTKVATTRRRDVTAGGARAAPAGGGGGAGGLVRSPPRARISPPQAAPWSGGGSSSLASLPMIGLDDAPPHNAAPSYMAAPPHVAAPPHAAPTPHAAPPATLLPHAAPPPHVAAPRVKRAGSTENSSSSSSSDSGSGSDSDSDSDRERDRARPAPVPRQHSGGVGGLPADVLQKDLLLSESGSDSD